MEPKDKIQKYIKINQYNPEPHITQFCPLKTEIFIVAEKFDSHKYNI